MFITTLSQFGMTALTGLLLLLAPFDDRPAQTPATADGLQRLRIGNARYVCGKADHPNVDAARRTETFSKGQHPFAAVLSCADSRVPVEVVFDQGIGDLFVIRVAGNVVDKQITGSLEYAVEHVHVPLIVVMGHRSCGAVAAACSDGHFTANIDSILDEIKPAVEQVRKQQPGISGDALVTDAIRANVYQSIEVLFKTSPDLREAAQKGELKVVGCIYDIESGDVNWLGAHPNQKSLLGEAGAGGGQDKAGKPAPDAAPKMGGVSVKEPAVAGERKQRDSHGDDDHSAPKNPK